MGELAAISARASDLSLAMLLGAVALPLALTESATTLFVDAGVAVAPEADSALAPSKLDLEGLERPEVAAEVAEEVVPVLLRPMASVTGGLSRWKAR